MINIFLSPHHDSSPGSYYYKNETACIIFGSEIYNNDFLNNRSTYDNRQGV